MIDKTGGPAFPGTEANYGYEGEAGMTLRDYFAAKAMSISWKAMNEGYFEPNGDSLNDQAATCAYQIADAMIRARSK